MEIKRQAQFTMSAGPVEATDRTLRAMSRPIFYHYDPQFAVVFDDTLSKLKAVFQTQQDVIIMQGEAILGLEAAAACCFQEGDTVLNLVSGPYGAGYQGYIERYGARSIEVRVPYNAAIDPDDVERALRAHPEVRFLSVVHSETPSGTLNPVREICTIAKKHGVLTIVDAVSSMGTLDIRPDEWGFDICVVGPQKGFSAPPGLALISVSDEAWEVMRRRKSPLRHTYLSMLDWKEKWLDDRRFPHTVLTSDVVALNEALEQMLEEGLENVFARHARAARACREGVKGLGLRLWPASEDIASPCCTALVPPEGIDEASLRQRMYEGYGVLISGGVGDTAGRLVRIGHMGKTADPMYVVVALAALERALHDLGHPVRFGSGVGAALAAL
jgi:pyridoxamine--pyruvate transaminase